jgi:DNA helicase IV
MNKRNATDLLAQVGMHVVVEDTPQFWSGVVLEAVAEVLPKLNPAWDAVVVDESQDLVEDDWLLIEELSRGKLLWAFWDPEQSFWPDRQVRAELFKTRYRLQNRYRCPEAVHMLAGCYLGETADIATLRSASEENVIAVRPCPGTGTVLDRIGCEIDRLLGSGLEALDIAVLSLRGGAEPESTVHRERIGTHRVVRAHDAEAGTNVVAETFLRFKGLERPAIIITDISLALDKPDYQKRMYIALTRALSTARIIDTRDSLLCDPFLCPLCS